MDCMKMMMEKMMGNMSGDAQGEMPGTADKNSSSMGDAGKKDPSSTMGPEEMEGNSFNPMDMCRKMMGAIGRTSELATFATPEIRGLFEEWAVQIEEEIMQVVKTGERVDPESVAGHFKLSKDSVMYFLTRLAQKGKISLEVKPVNQAAESSNP